MPSGDKPYRVYKGGRAKGKVPLVTRRAETSREDRSGRRGPLERGGRRPRRWGRRIGTGALLLAVLLVVWIVASYLAFRSGVANANERLPQGVEASLAAQDGLLTSRSTLILLLGTDGDRTAARADARRSDSILLVRTDPERHRLAYLSIPRDLRVEIPGFGANRINAAFQLGGPALAMRAIRSLTGLQPNHVALVDFADFRSVIDAIGGVTIDVPKPILSSRFDCPYATQARCNQWQGWRFEPGPQEMDGRRALIYSRIRENRLDPAENDLTRTDRQQAVVEAMTAKIVSLRTFVRLPFVGDEIVSPLTTDLSAGELLQLGWVRFRSNSDRALHCRLGGELGFVGGQAVIIGDEENFTVIRMFEGEAAPQPPPPGRPLAAGCVVGRGG